MSDALDDKVASRRRAEAIKAIRTLKQPSSKPGTVNKPLGSTSGIAPSVPGTLNEAATDEACEMCGTPLPVEHRHLLHLVERRILCACEVCIAQRAGDAEFRPSGQRVVWLDDLAMADELWARLGIPIALCFFTMNGDTSEVVAFYPSPAGSTECELDMDAWAELCEANPQLELEPDAEAFIVNRMSDPPQYVIVPIDECYAMVGAIKMAWEGISGGVEVENAIAGFFQRMRVRSEG